MKNLLGSRNGWTRSALTLWAAVVMGVVGVVTGAAGAGLSADDISFDVTETESAWSDLKYGYTVTSADSVTITISNKNDEEDFEDFSIEFEDEHDAFDVVESLEEIASDGIEKGGSTDITIAPKSGNNAGTYKGYIKITKEDWEDIIDSVTLTIGKVTLDGTNKDTFVKINETSHGVEAKSGVTGTGTFTTTWSTSSTNEGTNKVETYPTTAGTYYTWFKMEENQNFEAVTSAIQIGESFKIKETLSNANLGVEIEKVTYSGEEISLPSGYVITYSGDEDTTGCNFSIAFTATEVKNAGKYALKITWGGCTDKFSNDNVELSNAFEVEKLELTSSNMNSHVEINNDDHVVKGKDGVTGIGGITTTWSTANDNAETGKETAYPTTAGTYYTWFTMDAGSNYEAVTTAIQIGSAITITKPSLDVDDFTITGTTTATYSGEEITLPGNVGVNYTGSQTTTSCNFSVAFVDDVTVKDVGKYGLKISWPGCSDAFANNHVVKTDTFEVKKLTLNASNMNSHVEIDNDNHTVKAKSGVTGIGTITTTWSTSNSDASAGKVTSYPTTAGDYWTWFTTNDGTNYENVTEALQIGAKIEITAPSLAAEDFVLTGTLTATYSGANITLPDNVSVSYSGSEDDENCTYATAFAESEVKAAGKYGIKITWSGCTETFANADKGVTIADTFTVSPLLLTKDHFNLSKLPTVGDSVLKASLISLNSPLAVGDLSWVIVYDLSGTKYENPNVGNLSLFAKITANDGNYSNNVDDYIDLNKQYNYSEPVTITAPEITTTSLPGGTVGTAYSQSLTATGSTATWSLKSGDNLPGGLSLNAETGIISGTPTTAGSYNFNVIATNSAGNDEADLSIEIADPVAGKVTVSVSVNNSSYGSVSAVSSTSGDNTDDDKLPLSSPNNVTEGSTVTITAVPGSGYEVEKWTVGSVETEADGTPPDSTVLTLENVGENKAVIVAFREIPTPELQGSVVINGTTKVGVTLTANPTIISTSPGTLTYTWIVGGATKSGTGATYTLVSEDDGKKVKVKVTAANYSGEIESEEVGPVTTDTYSLEVSATTADFTTLEYGYSQPVAQTITITNTSSDAVTLIQPASTTTPPAQSNYIIGTLSAGASSPLAVNALATFTIQPKANLAVGTYSESIEIKTEGDVVSTITVTASFAVSKATSGLTAVPMDISISKGDLSQQVKDLSNIISLTTSKGTPGNVSYTLGGFEDEESILEGKPILTGTAPDQDIRFTGTGKETGVARLIVNVISDNYVNLPVTVTFTATPKEQSTPRLWPTASEITYGAKLSTSTLTPSSITSGTGTYGSFEWEDGEIIPTVENNGYRVIFTPDNEVDYSTASDIVQITVNKANPTITTPPTAATITYGAKLSTSALTLGAASVPGNFAWTNGEVIPTVQNSGYSVTFTPSDNSNYNAVELSSPVAVTVNKAVPAVTTWPTVSIVYGTQLSDAEFVGGNASVEGEYSFTADGAVKPTVAQSNTTLFGVTFTPDDLDNYNPNSTGNITVTVAKADPDVTWPTSAAITYGQSLKDAVWSGEDNNGVPGTFAFTNGTAIKPTVAQSNTEYEMTFTPTDDANYNVLKQSVAVTVEKASGLVATAPAPIRIMGGTTVTGTFDLSEIELTQGAGGAVITDEGTRTYTVVAGSFTDADAILNGTPTLGTATATSSILTYRANNKETGSDAVLQVAIGSQNYEDVTVALTFTMTSVYNVKLTGGVITGTSSVIGLYPEGDEVSITATAPPAGKYFAKWTATPAVVFDDEAAQVATFEMPGENVAIVAAYDNQVVAAPITGVTSPVAAELSLYRIDDGEGFTSKLEWVGLVYPPPESFDYSTVYTARITLTAADGWTFNGAFWGEKEIAGFTVNGNVPSSFVENTGAQLVFEVTFPKTAGAEITIDPTTPEDKVVTQGSIAGEVLEVAARSNATQDDQLLYKWYQSTTVSGANGTEVPGGSTTKYFTIPPELAPLNTTASRDYYFYAVVNGRKGEDEARSRVATVTVKPVEYVVLYEVVGGAAGNGGLTAAKGGAAFASGDKVYSGQTVVFTATPYSTTSKRVKHWIVNNEVQAEGISGAGNVTFTLANITKDMEVSVEFESFYPITFRAKADPDLPAGWAITAAYGNPVVSSTASPVEVGDGEVVKFAASAPSGWMVKESGAWAVVAGGGSAVQHADDITKADYRVSGAAATVEVEFVPIPAGKFVVNFGVVNDEGGTVSAAYSAGGAIVSGSAVEDGSIITFTANATSAGWQVKGWSSNVSPNPNNPNQATLIVRKTETVEVEFEAFFAVTFGPAAPSPSGAGVTAAYGANATPLLSGGVVGKGTVVTFTAVVPAGSQVKLWDGAAANAADKTKATVTVNSPVTVTVSFETIPVYSISATSLTPFETKEVGYDPPPAAQSVTVRNTGNNPITLNQPAATNYVIGALSAVLLLPNETATFSVRPKAGLGANNYAETITVTGSNGTNTATAAVSASFRVSSEPVFDMVLTPSDALDPFPNLQVGYTQAQLTVSRVVTVTNTGTSPINLSPPTATKYNVGALSAARIEPGRSATFTVQPKTGLAAGTHSEAITVRGVSGIMQLQRSVTAMFVVTPEPTYEITASPEAWEFPTATVPYTPPNLKVIIVKNTGTVPVKLDASLKVTQAPAGFVVGDIGETSLDKGQQTSFAIWPNAGLNPGTYTVTVEISGTATDAYGVAKAVKAAAAATFTVNAATEYKVTWNAGGGAPVPTQTSVVRGESIAKPADMTRSGYTFDAWYTNAEKTAKASFPVNNVREDKEFWARWRSNNGVYRISFNGNGGLLDPAAPAYVETDASGRLMYLPATEERTGYKFSAWYTTPKEGGKKVVLGDKFDDDATLYARWDKMNYNIVYVLDGGKVEAPAKNPTSYTVEDKPFELAAPSKLGYDFDGWTGSNGEDPEASVWVYPGSEHAENLKYTANWTPGVYVITFNPAGGELSEDIEGEGETVPGGWLTALPAKADVTRAGYDFKGWYTEWEGGVKVETGTAAKAGTVFGKDGVIYAQWTLLSYKITYNLNGGTLDAATPNPASYNVEVGGFVLNNPAKPGYEFIGWTGTNGADPELYVYIEYGSVGDRSYTANWGEAVSYTVTFDANARDATVSPETGLTGAGGRLSSPPPTPKRDGYSFDAWYTEKDEGGKHVSTSTLFISDSTVYARWYVPFTVTLNPNGGAVSPTALQTGADGTLLSLPTAYRDGYVMEGWYTSAGGGTQVTTTTKFGGDATIHAHWAVASEGILTYAPGANGTLRATVDGTPVASGAKVQGGKNVVFTAAPIDGYGVVRWTVNGVVHIDSSRTYTLWGFSGATEVMVTFDAIYVSVVTPDRVVPGTGAGAEAALVAPATLSAEFAAGPNPVAKQADREVKFYHSAAGIKSVTLLVYDESGKSIRRITATPQVVNVSGKRAIAVWDLKDKSGRAVSEGVYLVRGVVKTASGRSERVSVVVGVR